MCIMLHTRIMTRASVSYTFVKRMSISYSFTESVVCIQIQNNFVKPETFSCICEIGRSLKDPSCRVFLHCATFCGCPPSIFFISQQTGVSKAQSVSLFAFFDNETVSKFSFFSRRFRRLVVVF